MKLKFCKICEYFYTSNNCCDEKEKKEVDKKIKNCLYGIKQRCYDSNYPKFKDYGGRGIKVSDFILDPNNRQYEIDKLAVRLYLDSERTGIHWSKLSIDRIDNNGDYCLQNLRWSTAKEQSNNQRKKKRKNPSKFYYHCGEYGLFISYDECAKKLRRSKMFVSYRCKHETKWENWYAIPKENLCLLQIGENR